MAAAQSYDQITEIVARLTIVFFEHKSHYNQLCPGSLGKPTQAILTESELKTIYKLPRFEAARTWWWWGCWQPRQLILDRILEVRALICLCSSEDLSHRCRQVGGKACPRSCIKVARAQRDAGTRQT